LVGKSGCGKSTLTKLIEKFYDPTEGFIKIDGKNSKFLDPEVLRGAIGYVNQETKLFDGTLESNIAFGLDSYT
jgi:ABC-type multidrug transport system fused ATPase/permease subunit